MKRTRFIKLLGLAVILSLLMALVTAVPASALTYDIEIDPEEGKIGDEIEIRGEDFSPSTDAVEKWATVYFAKQADEGDDIGTDVETYEEVETQQIGWLEEADEGEFETTFEVPSELNDGSDDEDVASGTYYICVTQSTLPERIVAVAEFTVIGGEIEISPEEGPVDLLVEITGTDFSTRENIVIEFDGDEIDIEDGDDETDSSGDFESVIRIPPSAAGDYTITVIVGSNEVEAVFAVEPDLLITPQSGKAGDEITVSGTGFGSRTEVEIFFNDNGVATQRTGSDGSFTTTFTAPSGLEAGIYDIDADDGTNVANIKFTLTVAPPPEPTPEPTPTPPTPSPTPTPTPPTTPLSISQPIGNIGSSVMLGGTGFQPEATITIKYDGKEVAIAAADDAGTLITLLKVPASKYGQHKITASDGTITREVAFTVESVAPNVPKPLLPEMGVKAKSPVTFGWEEVTDESSPVTYTIQIAASKEFTAGSIILERTGVEELEYVLTEDEESELVSQETPYYWRVRAVDAASNEGEWTGAGEFYVSAPFNFPRWALYTVLVIGAVVIFGIGYWLGRRTAFYY